MTDKKIFLAKLSLEERLHERIFKVWNFVNNRANFRNRNDTFILQPNGTQKITEFGRGYEQSSQDIFENMMKNNITFDYLRFAIEEEKCVELTSELEEKITKENRIDTEKEMIEWNKNWLEKIKNNPPEYVVIRTAIEKSQNNLIQKLKESVE